MAPPPCTCSSFDIQCTNKRLSQVPVFSRHNEQYHYINLYMGDNQLTSIPAYAFQNLSAINASSVALFLSGNHIVDIELHAFSGIEHALTYLDLANNNLTHLPVALEELSSLMYLNLLGNPLLSLDATVLANISGKLNSFSISTAKFSSLSNKLDLLTKLGSLTINDIKVPFLHSTVFHSFENSLTALEMSYANFESMPAAVCRLKSLQIFTSNYSPNLSKYNASIFDECTHRMATVTSLTLQYDKLSIFPKIATLFPKLQYLDLRNNLLHFIPSTALLNMSSLSSLYISHNRFTSIPSAINRATNLQTLYVENNQIDTVEDFDLQRLHSLTKIVLSGNPLDYLSPYAFKHNPLIYSVNLYSTMLGRIPQALVDLKHLQYIYISRSVECSCNAMSYLQHWNVSAIRIYATCSTGKPVKTFLTTDLPNCS